jgi:hypothetical protein
MIPPPPPGREQRIVQMNTCERVDSQVFHTKITLSTALKPVDVNTIVHHFDLVMGHF